MQPWRLCIPLFACACATTVEPEPAAAPSAQSAQRSPTPAIEPATAPTNPPAEVPAASAFDPLLREVAAAYPSWGMVDNQFHWAPGLCAMPAAGVKHLSLADTQAAHAGKVFQLYALDAMAYWKATDTTARLPETLARAASLRSRTDVTQVLVKESFVATPLEGHARMDGGSLPARKGDARFGAGEPIGLFVMAKLRDGGEGTDDGWIYGTVAPDGAITSAGVIAACRDCHAQQADRVFGIPLQWK